ncbi:hypothetical protein [Aeromonas cavernicola]|uniref:hypothetical protein n=1 Tax=Aeromonas cavernicola TaxID=1006623 RepID=UPI0012FE0E37|nr:hypothetical protein [Aeromonas cavernicola]
MPSNSTMAVYGRQVTLEGPLTITTNGSTISVTQLPTVKDQDNDAHIGWTYVWEVAGSGSEQTTNILTTIPNLTPTGAMRGRSVQLKVKGLTETRSFPIETATSAVAASNSFTIPYSATSTPPTDQWRGYNDIGGTYTMDGRPVTVTVAQYGGINYDGYGGTASSYCGTTYPNAVGGVWLNNSAELIIRFSVPVTNIKIVAFGMDSGETVNISTNAASKVSIFGTFNAGANYTGCNRPTLNGNLITANPSSSWGYFASVGGVYFTELRIYQSNNSSGYGGTVFNFNYAHVTVSP